MTLNIIKYTPRSAQYHVCCMQSMIIENGQNEESLTLNVKAKRRTRVEDLAVSTRSLA